MSGYDLVLVIGVAGVVRQEGGSRDGVEGGEQVQVGQEDRKRFLWGHLPRHQHLHWRGRY